VDRSHRGADQTSRSTPAAWLEGRKRPCPGARFAEREHLCGEDRGDLVGPTKPTIAPSTGGCAASGALRDTAERACVLSRSGTSARFRQVEPVKEGRGARRQQRSGPGGAAATDPGVVARPVAHGTKAEPHDEGRTHQRAAAQPEVGGRLTRERIGPCGSAAWRGGLYVGPPRHYAPTTLIVASPDTRSFARAWHGERPAPATRRDRPRVRRPLDRNEDSCSNCRRVRGWRSGMPHQPAIRRGALQAGSPIDDQESPMGPQHSSSEEIIGWRRTRALYRTMPRRGFRQRSEKSVIEM
jgi:hypothetical protein